jgi:hypothetical protein
VVVSAGVLVEVEGTGGAVEGVGEVEVSLGVAEEDEEEGVEGAGAGVVVLVSSGEIIGGVVSAG